MSDIPADPRQPIDIQAIVARIDRDLSESAKLRAEAAKFNRDPWLLALTALLGLAAAISARLPEILHAMGLP
jgi:hypothetical protein